MEAIIAIIATIVTIVIIVILDMVTTTIITPTGIVGVEVIRVTVKRMITEFERFVFGT